MAECISRFVGVGLVALVIVVMWSNGAFAQDPQAIIPDELVGWVNVLLRFPSGPAEWGFIVAGLVGMIGHWYKKKRRGETHARLVDHFIANYPKSTFATLFVFWFVAVYLLEAVAIAAAHPGGAVAVGLAVGWWLDSMINKGDPGAV